MSAVPVEPASKSEGVWIRYAAILLSILLHIFLLANYGGLPTNTLPQPNPSIIQLSFQPPVPEPVKQPEVVPEKVKLKPKQKPESVPKPVADVMKKTVVKKAVEPVLREVIEEAVSKPESVVAAISVPTAVVPAPPHVDKGMIKRETDRYITKMMAHIEQYKRYPKAARRRGVEGDIIVRFTLFPDGTVDQLIVDNGPSLLVSAARRAVERAMPMPIPPAGIHCPLECQFRMAFHLTRS